MALAWTIVAIVVGVVAGVATSVDSQFRYVGDINNSGVCFRLSTLESGYGAGVPYWLDVVACLPWIVWIVFTSWSAFLFVAWRKGRLSLGQVGLAGGLTLLVATAVVAVRVLQIDA
jgi:hypothetical protein